MKKPDHIHPLIGPHEGRELELMLKGEKPAAMFYWVINQEEHIFEDTIAAFQPHVDTGKIIKKETTHPFRQHFVRYVFYSLPQFAKNIDRLVDIQNYAHNPSRKGIWPTPLEWEIGRLLGYSDEAIEYFLEHKAKFN